ncbi:hypothetical protein F4558_003561 [Micromonospora profundi]|nr:hypothetical protein [Micromonospora profundi]
MWPGRNRPLAACGQPASAERPGLVADRPGGAVVVPTSALPIGWGDGERALHSRAER